MLGFAFNTFMTANQQIQIEQVRQEVTWVMRQKAMYPGKNWKEMQMPEDNDGTHFGAFLPNKLAGVVSLFNKGDNFQFRKLAVDPDLQRQGIGSAILDYITLHAAEHGARRLWCNARVGAAAFYSRHGFAETDQRFTRNGINYVVMEKYLKQTEEQE